MDSSIPAYAARPLHYDWRASLAGALAHVTQSTVTADAAPTVLATLSGTQLLALDQSLRRDKVGEEIWNPQRRKPVPLPVHRPRGEIDALLFVYACDFGGNVREQALVALRDYPGRIATAAALIRCADWVEPVQQAAIGLLAAQLGAGNTEEFFSLFDLLVALRRRERIDDSFWDERIEPVLREPRHADARQAATRTGSRESRVFALELVGICNPERLPETWCELVHGPDVRLVLQTLRAASLHPEAGDVVVQALSNPQAAVRAEALRQHAASNPPDLRATLERFLFDPARAPRNIAAHLLRSRYTLDAASLWREVLDAPPSPRSAIALDALGDHATSDDIDRLRPWLAHPRAAMRAAALDALTRTRAPAFDRYLAEALGDPKARVVRNALRNYRIVRLLPPVEHLRSAYAATRNANVRRALAQAIGLLGKWNALDLILDWSAEPGDAYHAYLARELQRWEKRLINRFTPITAAEKARIAASIVRLRGRGHDLALPFKTINALEELVLHG